MRKKVGCEGGGENAAKPASNIGAVAGLSRGVARPVRKLRTKSAEKLFMEHLKLGTFAPRPWPAAREHTLRANAIYRQLSGSWGLWKHMDEAFPHARGPQDLVYFQIVRCLHRNGLLRGAAPERGKGLPERRTVSGHAMCAAAARITTPRARAAAVSYAWRILPRGPSGHAPLLLPT